MALQTAYGPGAPKQGRDRGMGQSEPTLGARDSRLEKGAWWALIVLAFIYFIASLDRNLLTLLVGPVKHYLHISDVKMSFLLGISFALFFAACAIPLGFAVDRFPRRLILFFGIVIWSLATVACGLAHSYGQLFVARMMLGASEAALAPAAHSILADKFPKEKLSTALSIYTIGAIVGTGASTFMGGLALHFLPPTQLFSTPIAGPLMGWQLLFIAVGGPGLALAFLAFSFAEPARRHVASAMTTLPSAALWPFLKRRRKVFGCFIGSFSVFVMLTYSGFAWIPTYMARHFHWSPGAYGPVLGAISITNGVIGSVGGGVIADWLLARGYKDAHLRLLIGEIVVAVPLGILAFSATNVYAFLALLFLFQMVGFTLVGYTGAAVQLVTPPALRGRMAALFLLTFAIVGSGLGPSLTALFTDYVLHDEAKVGLAYLLTILVCSPVALLFAWLGLKPLREAVDDARAQAALEETAGEAQF